MFISPLTGRKGVFTATSGLTLGYVSGYENKTKV